MGNFGCLKEEKLQLSTQEKYSFIWFIDNFQSHSSTTGQYTESPCFYADAKTEQKWSIDIYTAGCHETTCDYIGIRAYKFFKSHEKETTMVKFSILNNVGKKCRSKTLLVEGTCGTIEQFILRKDLLESVELLPNGQLSIACEILKLSDKDGKTEEVHQQPKNEQVEAIKKLFDTKKFSDFKFVVKGKEFLVHRAILGAQSPVFEAMFETEMRETTEGKVHIDDIEPQVIEKFLKFVYTGETDFENLTDCILIAAEKYQLESLKLLCEKELATSLSVHNVYDILLVADQNNAVYLKKMAIKFFDANIKEIISKDSFKTSTNSLSKDLLSDIISAIGMKR